MSKRLSRWMPWSDFTRFGREIRDQSNGLAISVGCLVLATVTASAALPRLSLLISILGGLLMVVVVSLATGQYRELVDGFVEIGGLPSGRVLARLIWQLLLTDVQRLWRGNGHSQPLTCMQADGGPQPREHVVGDDREVTRS